MPQSQKNYEKNEEEGEQDYGHTERELSMLRCMLGEQPETGDPPSTEKDDSTDSPDVRTRAESSISGSGSVANNQ